MPELGEIRRGRELGDKKSDDHNYIWVMCPHCENKRWLRVDRKKGHTDTGLCVDCYRRYYNRDNFKYRPKRGKDHYAWKGGRIFDTAGYIRIKLFPGDFFFSMTDKQGYVMEHRLIVARALGRCLHKWEIVHHKGVKYPLRSRENRTDNRYPENLQLISDDGHKQITIMEKIIEELRQKVKELEDEKKQNKTS